MFALLFSQSTCFFSIGPDSGVTDFGRAVKSAGDVNADGFPDFMVDGKSGEETIVYLYFGGAQLDSIPDAVFNTTGSSLAGCTFDKGGDINGDGFDDIVIGQSAYNSKKGRILIYYGSSSFDTIPDIIINGDGEYPGFGSSVCGGLDINNDGYNDIIVASDLKISPSIRRFYIFYGQKNIDSTANITFLSTENSTICPIQAAGKVNNDDFDDFIIGHYAYTGDDELKIKSNLYLSSANTDSIPDILFEGITPEYWKRQFIDGCGDFNNDGFNDILFGAGIISSLYLIDPGEVTAVRDTVILQLNHDLNGFNNGQPVCFIGDYNKDGIDDMATATYPYVSKGLYSYNVNLYFGRTTDSFSETNLYEDEIIEGKQEDFGYSLAGIGDVNGDSYSDLLIGQPAGPPAAWPPGNSTQSKVFLFSHNQSLSPVQIPPQGTVSSFILHTNYPNPFNATTMIHYTLTAPVPVNLDIYNIRGQRVARLYNGKQTPGEHRITWDAGTLASGIYIIQITASKHTTRQKCILLK